MRLILKGRHVELVPSIRDHAARKLARLSDQLGDDVPVEVELSEQTRARHVAEATVYTKGTTLRARASAKDLRGAIDRVARTLERQLVRYRAKRRLEPRRRARG